MQMVKQLKVEDRQLASDALSGSSRIRLFIAGAPAPAAAQQFEVQQVAEAAAAKAADAAGEPPVAQPAASCAAADTAAPAAQPAADMDVDAAAADRQPGLESGTQLGGGAAASPGEAPAAPAAGGTGSAASGPPGEICAHNWRLHDVLCWLCHGLHNVCQMSCSHAAVRGSIFERSATPTIAFRK